MANNKITQLTELAATPETTDMLPIVDLSATETKKITVANLTALKADKTTQIIAGTGMSGSGTLASDTTLNCTITQYTDELAQAAVGTILANSSNVTLTYSGATPSITADLVSVGSAGTYKSVTTDAKGRVTAGTNPTTLAGYGITDAQPLGADLTALAALSTTGMMARTASNTYTMRTITGSTGLTVSNGDGVSGNPTLTLDSDLTALAGMSTTGMLARTGTGTMSARTITGSTGITVSNGNGVSGNPTISTNDAQIVHNNLSGYDANRHIDHTAVSISTGTGLTGGGTIASTRTISLDFNALTEETSIVDGDFLPLYDVSESAHNKVSVGTLRKANPLVFSEHEEFTRVNAGELTATTAGTGGTSTPHVGTSPSIQNHFGVWQLAGGSANGTGIIRESMDAYVFGGSTTYSFEFLIYLPTASDGTDTYKVRIGVMDTAPTIGPDAESTNGVYFKYDSTVSANWIIYAVKTSGSASSTTTSTAVSAASWITLRIDINASSSATFYVNGSSVGTHSSNVPSATNEQTGIVARLAKTAGTNSRSCYIDYWSKYITSTSRA